MVFGAGSRSLRGYPFPRDCVRRRFSSRARSRRVRGGYGGAPFHKRAVPSARRPRSFAVDPKARAERAPYPQRLLEQRARGNRGLLHQRRRRSHRRAANPIDADEPPGPGSGFAVLARQQSRPGQPLAARKREKRMPGNRPGERSVCETIRSTVAYARSSPPDRSCAI